MERHVVLDTETTGLNVSDGHRVIEIGAVEVIGRRLTKSSFHVYLNPGRAIDAGAIQVHGITEDFLADKPRFEDVAKDFIAFIDGAQLVIHNAAFDVAFLNQELARLPGPKRRVEELCEVLDSLALARERHPGQRNSLDALCARYEVDNSRRTYHGALLDAEILAEVFLAMTGGQVTLELDCLAAAPDAGERVQRAPRRRKAALPVLRASAQELALHEARLEAIDKASGGRCVWLSGDC
jgi:DNA polymerase-3 subunit epsilon